MQDVLNIYNNAVVEMATNKDGVWDQGQIAILRELPSQEEVDNWLPLKAMLGPPSDSIPPVGYESMSNEELERSGWREVNIFKVISQKVSLGTLIGRRTQYPIRSRNASTIHKICGDTLRKGATQISSDPKSKYYLWEKGLAVVLVTRFQYLSDLVFVDPLGRDHVVDVLLETMNKTRQFYLFQKMIIEKVGIRHETDEVLRDDESVQIPSIDLDEFPYMPKDYPLPSALSNPNGFLYLLISLKDKRCTYIGETTNLKRRLIYHNQGNRSGIADISKRPWIPLLFFTGFESEQQRRSLELTWQNRRDHLSWAREGSVVAIMRLGVNVCKNQNESRIILHKCYVMKELNGDPSSGF